MHVYINIYLSFQRLWFKKKGLQFSWHYHYLSDSTQKSHLPSRNNCTKVTHHPHTRGKLQFPQLKHQTSSPTKTSFSSKKSNLQPKNHHPRPKTPTKKQKIIIPNQKIQPKNQKIITPNQKKSNQNIIIPKQQNVCHQQNTSQLKRMRCATVLPRLSGRPFQSWITNAASSPDSWRLLNDRRDLPVIFWEKMWKLDV